MGSEPTGGPRKERNEKKDKNDAQGFHGKEQKAKGREMLGRNFSGLPGCGSMRKKSVIVRENRSGPQNVAKKPMPGTWRICMRT